MAAHRESTSGAALKQYFTTSFENVLLDQMPTEDAELTPATRLLEKQRELAGVTAEQEAHKNRYDGHMRTLKAEREDILVEEAKLNKSIHDYDTYLKENDIRRRRALKKMREEGEACATYGEEIKLLKDKIADLQTQISQQEQELLNQEVFETYLKNVIKETHDFDQITELIDRHATLKVTNEELVQQEEQNKLHMQRLQQDGARARENHKVASALCALMVHH